MSCFSFCFKFVCLVLCDVFKADRHSALQLDSAWGWWSFAVSSIAASNCLETLIWSIFLFYFAVGDLSAMYTPVCYIDPAVDASASRNIELKDTRVLKMCVSIDDCPWNKQSCSALSSSFWPATQKNCRCFLIVQLICQSDLEAKSRIPNWPAWPWRTRGFMWIVALRAHYSVPGCC